MSAFAGILRHDNAPIDGEWIARLSAAPAAAGRTCHVIRTARSLCVVEYGAATADCKSTIFFDGRIDNRNELATALNLPAADLPDTDDASLIAQACDRWGDDCVPRLIGDFALAQWRADRT